MRKEEGGRETYLAARLRYGSPERLTQGWR